MASVALAQQASPPTSPPPAPAPRTPTAAEVAREAAASADNTVVLSPFEVNADLDTGYLATTAQSGTRLRTELKDIASSISVVTKDFMNDVGATDLGGLLVYTLGTEVNGVGGNFSDAGVVANPNGNEADYDGAFASAAPSTRVRGLTSADLSRDFFITSIPMDGYNTDRVEISRGPNAMLFGLGSPAGIINNSLITANLRSRKTTVELRNDQYGSVRTALDHNQVLLRDKLAVRVASVYDEQSYRVEEAWRRNKRAFLTATYRPMRDTTIRASVEIGAIDSNLPESRPPFDAYTFWWDAGRPVWDPTTNTGFLLGTPAAGYPNPFTATGAPAAIGAPPGNTGRLFSAQLGAVGGGNRPMVIVYNDPTSSTPSLGIPGSSLIGIRAGNYPGRNINAAGALAQTEMRGMRDSATILNQVLHWNDITANFWKSTQITDPAIFDFYNHMLHGPNKHEWARFHTYNATIEQRLLDGKAGAELAFNRDSLDNGSMLGLDSIISGYSLRIDMQNKLPDGRPNPNFGRPFTVAYSKASVRAYDRDTARATGYYNLDLRKTGSERLGKILGLHRFTGTYSKYENTALLSNGNFAIVPGTDFSLAQWGVVDNNGSGRRGLPIMRYLGPDVSASATPAAGAIGVPASQWPGELTSANILYYNAPAAGATTPGTFSERSFSIAANGDHDVEATRRYVAFTREKVDSAVAIAQSYWLNGKLVSTLGWRRDDVKTYNAGSPVIDPDTGRALLDESYQPKPVLTQSETSFNYGIVGHSPEFINRRLPFGSQLSLSYNKSDNFKPAGQRYDIWDVPMSAETGTTKEYGVMLTTLNGKLVVRAGRYETSSGLSSSLVSGLSTPIGQLLTLMRNIRTEILEGTNAGNPTGVAAWNQWWEGPIGSHLRSTFRFTERVTTNPTTGEPVATITSDSRGSEVFETADVISKGEEIEVVLNPTRNWRIAFNANRSEAVRNRVAPNLRKVFDDLRPVASGPAGALRVNDANTTTLADTYRTIYAQLLPHIATEGAPSNELREWRWNAVTNYTFANDGKLKGFSVGGGVRWQDKVAYGFPIINDPTFGIVPDVRNPYYGPTDTSFDAWIGYGRKFKKVAWRVQLNVRNIGVGDELIPVGAQPDGSVNSWRIRETQSFSLRNTFTF
ncbi:MAG TPA: TonB-dependent receptor plug domain-containing protein [Opitutaceae bacterium]